MDRRARWWHLDSEDDRYSVHGPRRVMTFDLPLASVHGELSEPSQRFTHADGIEVLEWDCGCTACHADGVTSLAILWCRQHAG